MTPVAPHPLRTGPRLDARRRAWHAAAMFAASFQTPRLLLRPVAASDAAAIFDGYAQDGEVTRYLSWRPHAAIDETERYVRACLDSVSSRTYMLVMRTSDAVVGGFDLRRPAPARLEVGYVLARREWGAGLMTEALREVIGWALRQPAIWRIGAFADIDNHASARVMEKAGMQREGVLRRWLVHPAIGDAPRDCVGYAAVR